jgi:hypothetical protein
MCAGPDLFAAFQALGAFSTAASAVSQIVAKKPPDPAKLQAEADAKASQSANARLAARNKALASNSLLTGAPTDGGKTTFGG